MHPSSVKCVGEALLPALYDSDPEVQSIGAEGFSRILLHRIPLTHGNTNSANRGQHDIREDVLSGLLHLYFHPSTKEQAKLRQCLSYFLPAFALSHPDNQRMLQKVLVPFLQSISNNTTNSNNGNLTGGGQRAELSLAAIADQLFHLANPANLLPTANAQESSLVGKFAMAKIGEELGWAVLRSEESSNPNPNLASLIPRIPDLEEQGGKFALQRLFIVLRHLLGRCPGVSSVAMRKFIARLVELGASDSTGPEESGEHGQSPEELQAQLRREFPVLGLHSNHQPTTVNKPKKAGAKKTITTTNIMDEIEDFEEEEHGKADHQEYSNYEEEADEAYSGSE